MTLRIFEKASEHGTVIALHGWLNAPEVAELERVASGRAGRLTVDLAQLVGADADGLKALGRLREGGARLAGASPYIELMLGRSAGGR